MPLIISVEAIICQINCIFSNIVNIYFPRYLIRKVIPHFHMFNCSFVFSYVVDESSNYLEDSEYSLPTFYESLPDLPKVECSCNHGNKLVGTQPTDY